MYSMPKPNPDQRWHPKARRNVRDLLPKSVNDNGLIEVAESYSAREAAYLFGVTWDTIRKWFVRKLIPYVRTIGCDNREKCYRVRHRALMRWVAEHPEHEYVLDKLQGNLDRFEPVTLDQKNQEILRAIARSPRPPEVRHDPIHQNRNQKQEPKPDRVSRAGKRFSENHQDSEWPW